ncbi:hypothetical protein BS78_04G024000 [Paspalum vaginatum]|nr:hypothetical protein BS78_04G024000 [Paspalum vaginatum]
MASSPPHRARRGGVSIETLARPVAVDHRISIHHYFRVADSLLRQANAYRDEEMLVDLYTILLRYTSLLLETTIPKHRGYSSFKAREKEFLKKGPHSSEKLLHVVSELESLKPVVVQQIGNHEPGDLSSKSLAGISPSSGLLQKSSSSSGSKHHQSAQSPSVQPGRHTIKPYSNLPYPKEETLSRHSVLGPNGLRGQWTRPVVTGTRIEYPRNNYELIQSDISSLVPAINNQDGLHGPTTAMALQDKNDDMLCVLALDDGRWPLPIEQQPASAGSPGSEAEFSHNLNIRQPSPPPVLAQVHPERGPIPPPSRVAAGPRPGLATSETECRYQNLHVPVALMDCFLRVAEANTAISLETCGILAGTLKRTTFYVTTLIIPKQKSTSDSCQATNEEEIFEVQDKGSLLSLGWIHTHPTQTCFLSSVDLHNHYAYQVMLPEAIAIVMAPTDDTRKHGIFHLTDPCGMGVIHDCDATGFHPHEEPLDGMPIYEHCSHVYMNPNLNFEMVDLREA